MNEIPTEEKVDKTLSENRWLPPSPHKEEILKVIEEGAAHIEERGHNIPPLLVFEDGGVIELPKARYMMTPRGMQIVSAGDSSKKGQTKHYDVCTSLDELKEILKEKPELAKSNPDLLNQLLDDARYMVSRMQKRRGSYEKFTADIASFCKRLEEVEGPDQEQALKKLEQIRAFLKDNPEKISDKIEDLYELAEGVRDVANNMEGCLATYKNLAIKIGILYEGIKGGRTWKKEEN